MLLDPNKPPILLIHGLWVTATYWEHWIPYLEHRGYEVYAPEWPGVDGRSPAEVRADPRPMANKHIEEIVEYYAAFAAKLGTPPIIIGHSFGGLFAQILLSRGLGVAGVAICPAQPAGIITLPYATFRAALPVIKNRLNASETVAISERHFRRCFFNDNDDDAVVEESSRCYERYCVPGVARVLWQLTTHVAGGKSAPTHVDFDKPDRAPLLLLAAGEDRVVPASTVRKNFRAYVRSGPAVVECEAMPGRTHGMIFQPGWEDVAERTLEFVERHSQ
ncbi:arylesterase-like protein [Colletotrichum sojae]|uniref:Arylesterase-like protein n=1 Tax=Colletotrichum sojae TaxID=2175907 RepID=A0A8H6JK10_9PEZI|nr:arylesterase-like protein [Colletotrichum sojae]